MPKSDYIKPTQDAFSAQLQQYKNNIGGYATLLGVTPAQVTSQAADADYFRYVLLCQEAVQNAAQQWTKWKDLVRGGGTAPATGAPLLPVFPTAVTAVPLGIEVRFRALSQQNKVHPNYNAAIGEALGTEGAEQTAPDLSTIAPVITATVTGNHVAIGWGWGGNGAFLDACEIEVERTAAAGFTLLAQDTTPGYNDTAAFPAAPAKWSYRAIYRVGDAQVGVWSNTVSVTVGG